MKIKKNGKVIRLTESDLQRIVKRVLNEEVEEPTDVKYVVTGESVCWEWDGVIERCDVEFRIKKWGQHQVGSVIEFGSSEKEAYDKAVKKFKKEKLVRKEGLQPPALDELRKYDRKSKYD